MNLADLQSCFATALLEGQEGLVVDALDGGHFQISELLALYRDSIHASLAAVLAAAAPADPAKAIAFIRSRPPNNALLYRYAAEYAAHVQNAPSAAGTEVTHIQGLLAKYRANG